MCLLSEPIENYNVCKIRLITG